MGLPTPAELNDLSRLLVYQERLCMGKWDKFANVSKSIMSKLGPAALQSGVTQGAASLGVSSGAHIGFQIGAVSVGTAFAPVGVALAPWIGAATIASQAGKIFSLHDLKADALKSGSSPVNYTCNCGNCAKSIKYVLDKKERDVALVAIGVATVGVSAIFKAVHSMGKSVTSAIKGEQRPKELTCRALIDSARGGCTVAMATIFLLSGSWSFTGNRDASTMATAVAIMTSKDGWEKLKTLW